MTERLIIRTTGQTGPGVVPLVATGTAATDTAAIQAAHDALPSTGGVIQLGAGNFALTSTGLTFTKPVHLRGAGAGTYESGGTRLQLNSTTATALTLSGAGFKVSDLCVENTSSTRPTAGAGILATDSDFARFNNVTVIGFWNGIQVDAGYYYTVDSCAILNPRNYGCYFRNTASGQFDHGDQGVVNSTITKYGDTVAGGTAIRWESGGGLRVIGCKINGWTQPGYTSTQRFARGIHLAVADGVSTSVFPIVGNSIENCTTSFVEANCAGPANTGEISKIVVTGNEIGIGGVGVVANPAVTGRISNVHVSGNFIGNSDTPITFTNVDQISVGPNQMTTFSSGAVGLGAGCTNVAIERQHIANVDNIRLVYDDSSLDNSVRAFIGAPNLWDSRTIPAVTSSVTYVTLYTIQLAQYSGATIELDLNGQISGVGAFAVNVKRLAIQGVTASVPTLTTVGTDTTAGTVPTIEWQVTSNFTVRIRVRLPGSGTDVIGRATVRVDGTIQRFWRGLDS